VGVETSSAASFQVFPNPFNSIVVLNHRERNQKLIVYNAMGQQIKLCDYIPEEMDLSSHPAGLYIFKTSQGEMVKVLKL